MPYRAPPAAPKVLLHYWPRGPRRPLPRLVWRIVFIGSLVAAWAWNVTLWSAECRRTEAGVDCEVEGWRLIGKRSRTSVTGIGAIVTREGARLDFARVAPAGEAAEAEAATLRGLGVNATASAILMPTASVGSAEIAERIESFVDSSAPRLSTRAGVGRAVLYGLLVLLIIGVELFAPPLGRMTLMIDPTANLLTVASPFSAATRFELDQVADVEIEHQAQGVHRAVLVLRDGRRVALDTSFRRGGQHHALADALRPHLRRT